MHIQLQTGFYRVTRDTKIYFSVHEGAQQNAEYLAGILRRATGFGLICSPWDGKPLDQGILFTSIDPAGDTLGDEGYTLQVSEKTAIISSSTATGGFYGVQTFRQMLPAEIESQTVQQSDWFMPCAYIIDRPAFKWRGMLLDCGRHFMSKAFILRYLDLLAYYKMNRFHWHLTEDQGWRIEIKKYPKLTEIGAWRKEENGEKYGGFYTQADIREVVKYAADRHIMVIPEIEMPGHSVAALASYPSLSCTGGPFKVETGWGVFKDIYCAGNDSTFSFLEHVLDEVIQLFPAPYIHIGGDEAPYFRWNNCKKCQALLKRIGAKNAAELQGYFIKRIETYLNSKNRQIIGWDEILDGGIAPGATVQSWRGFDGALKAARAGHDAIVSPTAYAYFDYPVKSTPLEKVYEFDPIPDSLENQYRKHILGGECNMWTEYAPEELVDSKIFPRILAMSEILWTYPAKRNVGDFLLRVSKHYPRLDVMGVKYGYERNPVNINAGYNERENTFLIGMLPGQKDIELYYTTDGSEPTLKSTKYQSPFILRNSAVVNVRIYRNGAFENETYSRTFTKHLGIGKGMEIINKYSPSYPAGGDKALLDGCRGGKSYRDGLWQGYHKDDLDVIISLGDRMPIRKVTVGFLQNIPSWIFFPEFVELSVSENGKDFTAVSLLSKVDLPNDDETHLQDFVFNNLEQLETRYLRIRAKNIEYCPDWHDGAGGEAWLFVDEIIIE